MSVCRALPKFMWEVPEGPGAPVLEEISPGTLGTFQGGE